MTPSTLAPTLTRALKRALYSSPLGRFHGQPKYPFLYEPRELVFFCECIERTSTLPGPLAEVGCFRGNTTVFLAKYLRATNRKNQYYAFDTFEGFTNEEIAFERNMRGKNNVSLIKGFSTNTQRMFDRTMQVNEIDNVTSRKADANHYAFDELVGCSFCLLDMDLYLPIKSALNRIYDKCSDGAFIVVDDCYKHENLFDGSLQAYTEFTQERRLPFRIEFGRIGVIVKEGAQ